MHACKEIHLILLLESSTTVNSKIAAEGLTTYVSIFTKKLWIAYKRRKRTGFTES